MIGFVGTVAYDVAGLFIGPIARYLPSQTAQVMARGIGESADVSLAAGVMAVWAAAMLMIGWATIRKCVPSDSVQASSVGDPEANHPASSLRHAGKSRASGRPRRWSIRTIVSRTVINVIRIDIEAVGAIGVNLGAPRFNPRDIPLAADERRGAYRIEVDGRGIELYALSMGNPHAVLIVDDVDTADVASLGPAIQRHPLFPEGVNVGFMQIIDRSHVRLRVYERGAGETQACGSGSCAAVVAGIANNRLDKEVDVGLKRGHLSIKWDGAGGEVWMTGPAVMVFEGQIEI